MKSFHETFSILSTFFAVKLWQISIKTCMYLQKATKHIVQLLLNCFKDYPKYSVDFLKTVKVLKALTLIGSFRAIFE